MKRRAFLSGMLGLLMIPVVALAAKQRKPYMVEMWHDEGKVLHFGGAKIEEVSMSTAVRDFTRVTVNLEPGEFSKEQVRKLLEQINEHANCRCVVL